MLPKSNVAKRAKTDPCKNKFPRKLFVFEGSFGQPVVSLPYLPDLSSDEVSMFVEILNPDRKNYQFEENTKFDVINGKQSTLLPRFKPSFNEAKSRPNRILYFE